MTDGIAYIDGQTMPLHEARIPLIDRGHLLGDGVFETVRVAGGKPFRIDDHAARIGEGLRFIELEDELVSEFRAAVDGLVKAGVPELGDELYVRVQISTGPMDAILESERGILVSGIAKPFKPYPREYLEHGIHVIMSTRRKDRFDPMSRIKTVSYLPYITARREAHSQAAHDALLRNDAGRIAEATTSNAYAYREGTVYAPGPEEGALDGVTRAVVLELLADMGIEVEERLETRMLDRAEEAWLTNTTGGVVPIRRVVDRDIGEGRGPLVKRLQGALDDQMRG